MHALLARVGCERTTRACLAERNLLRVLEGGCSVPIGVETGWDDGDHNKHGGGGGEDSRQGNGDGKDDGGVMARSRAGAADGILTMHAAVLSTDGARAVEASASRFIASREEADAFGKDVAAMLVERGAAEILREIELDRGVVEGQGGA